MRQGYHDFLIAVHLKTHADARQSAAKEYIIPLVRDLQQKNIFDDDSDNRYPHVLGPVVSILPVMMSEPVKQE